MKKQCRLIVRSFFSEKIIADEKYDSITDAKRAFREKYRDLCNIEYAIFCVGEKPKFKYY